MTTCEQVQAQMLGYLYDLLDDVDKAALDHHVAGCENCQKALASARRQQRLLATAAKTAFPTSSSAPHAARPVKRAARRGIDAVPFAWPRPSWLPPRMGSRSWLAGEQNELQGRLSAESALAQARGMQTLSPETKRSRLTEFRHHSVIPQMRSRSYSTNSKRSSPSSANASPTGNCNFRLLGPKCCKRARRATM